VILVKHPYRRNEISPNSAEIVFCEVMQLLITLRIKYPERLGIDARVAALVRIKPNKTGNLTLLRPAFLELTAILGPLIFGEHGK
jgi:hypothetical protein